MNKLVYRYKELNAQFKELSIERQFYESVAKKMAQRRMWLGLGVIVGQFVFVSVGTYHIWSWDIVEPLAYFNGLIASTILTATYFWTRNEFDTTSYHEYLTKKYLDKLLRRNGFDPENYENIKAELNQTILSIKNNILSDL